MAIKPMLSVVPRDAAFGDTVPGELLDPSWEPTLRARRREVSDWGQYMAIASQVVGRFHGQFGWNASTTCTPSRCSR